MSNLFLEVSSGFDHFRADGQYLALFFGSIFLLFFRKKKEFGVFLQYVFWSTVFLFVPFTAFLFMRYRTNFYRPEEIYAVLPMFIVISLGFTECLEEIKRICLFKRMREKFLVFSILILLIFFCGTATPFQNNQAICRGENKIALEEEQILQFLSEENEEVILWAPNEIVDWARGYDGKIKLIYGRDIYEPKLGAFTYDCYDNGKEMLYRWMSINWIEVEAYSLIPELTFEEAIELAKYYGCNRVVLKIDQIQNEKINEYLQNAEKNERSIKKIFSSDHYFIYELNL